MKKISKVWIAAAVVAIVALVSWLLSGGKKQEEVTFDTAKVAPANLMNSVTADGRYTGERYCEQIVCRLQHGGEKRTGDSRT